MTLFDFEFTRSKGKVTRVAFAKKCRQSWFLLIILRTVYHRAFIFHVMIGLGEITIPYVFNFTRSKVKVT